MNQKKRKQKLSFPKPALQSIKIITKRLSNSNIKFGDPSSLNSNIVHNQFILPFNNFSFLVLVKIVLDRSKNNVLVLIFAF